jgi:hypothetical protein
VRLNDGDEQSMADFAEASLKARAESDVLERDIASDAEQIIAKLLVD